MSAAIACRTLLVGRGVQFDEFTCEPGDPAFVRRSYARTHLLCFPKTSGVLRQAGDEPLVFCPDVAVFHNGGREYTAKIIEPEREVTQVLRLDDALLREAVREFDPAVDSRGALPIDVARVPIPASLVLRQSVLAARARAARADPSPIEEGLLGCLREVLSHSYARRRQAPRKAVRADAIRAEDYARWTQEHIARTFREPQSIHDVAAKIGLSTYHLCRVFRAVTGDTLHGFRDRLRLRTALGQLAEPGVDLSGLAVAVGYSSQSHFCDAFRRCFGVTPGAARSMLRGEALAEAARAREP